MSETEERRVGESELAPGLYVVATPIGHLEDITLRGLRILGGADVIAAEDTRHAKRLLQAHQIQRPLISLHRDNEAHRSQQILARLSEGQVVALISDAGTPCISDPGYVLIKETIDAGHRVFPIPGPSAAIAALSASGLPSHHFVFLGFLPAREGRRRKALAPYASLDATLILYEAPHRIVALLETLRDVLGDRDACLAREMTKLFEEFLHGSLSQLREILSQREAIKGEIVLLVRGAEEATLRPLIGEAGGLVGGSGLDGGGLVEQAPSLDEQIQARAAALLATGKRPAKLARKLTSDFPSLSRKEAYQRLEALKKEQASDDEPSSE